MLRIRLTKIGDGFRIVVIDQKFPRDGRAIEVAGTYKPKLAANNPERVRINFDVIEYWTSKGAQPSDTVKRLIKKSPEKSSQ